MPPPKIRKLAIMGFRSVGKSSLTIQFVEHQFVDAYDPTIENTFEKIIKVGNQEFNIKIVDTAGQDEYSIFPQSLSVGINGFVLVYSVTSQKSFEIVQIIHEKLLDTIGKVTVPIVLVGNKIDLVNDRIITTQMGRDLANSWNAAFIESSAKKNEMVETIFKAVLELIERNDGTSPKTDKDCTIL
ncbi:GTP-binding protein Rheb-like [Antedon mediterranea]|uniref:GTP-binding protein Rheb-like n=1 Tax=Antedon mediterranea TaxID=105859 RepID=UPI003AF960F0